MRRSMAAALILTALLFGGAYLTTGGSAAQEPESGDDTAQEPSGQGRRDSTVLLTVQDGDTAEEMALDAYLRGVVRGEMPASFETEALRAQAAAERTYVYHQLAAGRKEAHLDADVCTDPGCCSAWLSEEAAQEKWGDDFTAWEERIEDAVAATDGQVALYRGEPILAVFHSSSSGRTAEAGDVWSGDVPYLRSVDSPEGEEVPNYRSQVVLTAEQVRQMVLDAYPGADLSRDGSAPWRCAVRRCGAWRCGASSHCGRPALPSTRRRMG